MKAPKRQLSNLPGWKAAAADVLSGDSCVGKGDLRSVGAWVPPPSITRVTPALVRALALGVVRQQTQLDAVRLLQEEQEKKVVPIFEARLYRNRAAGRFGPEWFMREHNGGDPTL